jgi:hypothetical protein
MAWRTVFAVTFLPPPYVLGPTGVCKGHYIASSVRVRPHHVLVDCGAQQLGET